MLGVEVFLNYVSQPIRILREKDEALTVKKTSEYKYVSLGCGSKGCGR